ncbi:DUF1127 domain-containing protein [Pseudooceanicola sp. CBS1P-1]|uniref:DUF1127 domain-containing protein n=1 Tax=Pseudooceanicola albus TaxID=2692189 RepID=A0A6L7G852_9RHOB|nr:MULTISPECIES: DUF1127 domain-containing protein [Pseudooceanicola]MBT9385278.1 DUF1127 domain-containing protein [Pseudooceanicola endophyticus]MXN18863.1 DUF1127 domain-containing protein [Pseudooceanicola albus]
MTTQTTNLPVFDRLTLATPFAAPLGNPIAALRRLFTVRRAVAELQNLSDYELDDLGIGRSEIRARVEAAL